MYNAPHLATAAAAAAGVLSLIVFDLGVQYGARKERERNARRRREELIRAGRKHESRLAATESVS